MASKLLYYKLLAFGRKYNLGRLYFMYAEKAYAYVSKKKDKLFDDFDFDGGVPEYIAAPYILAYGRFEFYTFVFSNIVGAATAKFFPFLVTDFVYDTGFFFYNNLLLAIIGLPLIGACALFFIPPEQKHILKLCAFVFAVVSFFTSVLALGFFDLSSEEFQFLYQLQPFEEVGFFRFIIGVDGLSILLITLTNFLFALCFWFHLTEKNVNFIKEQCVVFFLLQFSILMAFVALDVVLFYLFFEASLVPLFLFIGIWGSRERKVYAAYKMFFYTLVGSMPTLVGLLLLLFMAETSDLTYIANINFDLTVQKLIWALLFLSFAVKLPMVPVHLWLPEAHVEATTTGSVILAGILLKLGGYGFFRFLLTLFPNASVFFAPFIFLLSLFAIIFASLVALRQIDMKKIIAYSSIAHMGFISLGFICLDSSGVYGAFFILLSHGFISAGLFFCAGILYSRYKTKLIHYFSSFASVMPIFSLFFSLFVFGNIGLPSTSGFVGEFFVFVSLTQVGLFTAFFAVFGVVLVVCYSLWLYNRVCFGHLSTKYIAFYQDINEHEFIIMLLLVAPVFVFGLTPQLLFDFFDFFARQLIVDFFLFEITA